MTLATFLSGHSHSSHPIPSRHPGYRSFPFLPLSEEPLVLEYLVADPVHGRDDGGVRVADVDRRHVGHGGRAHDVGRHVSLSPA